MSNIIIEALRALRTGKPMNEDLDDWEWYPEDENEASQMLEEVKTVINQHRSSAFWKKHHIYIELYTPSGESAYEKYAGYSSEVGFCEAIPESASLHRFTSFNEFYNYIQSDEFIGPNNLHDIESISIWDDEIDPDVIESCDLDEALRTGKPMRENKSADDWRIEWYAGESEEEDEQIFEKVSQVLRKYNDENFWKNHYIHVEGDYGNSPWSASYGYSDEYGFCSYTPENDFRYDFNNFQDFYREINSDEVLDFDNLESFEILKGQVEWDDIDESCRGKGCGKRKPVCEGVENDSWYRIDIQDVEGNVYPHEKKYATEDAAIKAATKIWKARKRIFKQEGFKITFVGVQEEDDSAIYEYTWTMAELDDWTEWDDDYYGD